MSIQLEKQFRVSVLDFISSQQALGCKIFRRKGTGWAAWGPRATLGGCWDDLALCTTPNLPIEPSSSYTSPCVIFDGDIFSVDSYLLHVIPHSLTVVLNRLSASS